MTDHQAERAQPSVDIDAAALQKAEEYIEQEEGASNKLKGWLAAFRPLVAVVMSGYHLYTAYEIVPAQTLRAGAPGLRAVPVLPGVPGRGRHRHRIMVGLDRRAARHGGHLVPDAGRRRPHRPHTSPLPWDIFGIAMMALVLEAMRRTSGWIMPVMCLAFIAYAPAVPGCPRPGPTRATVGRLVGVMYMTPRASSCAGRVVLAHHPVHHLRRLPAVFGRRQVLSRLLVLRHGRQADRRRPHRGRVLPAGRPRPRAWPPR